MGKLNDPNEGLKLEYISPQFHFNVSLKTQRFECETLGFPFDAPVLSSKDYSGALRQLAQHITPRRINCVYAFRADLGCAEIPSENPLAGVAFLSDLSSVWT